ncbi:MAG: proline--tRNA ligase [Puniceicoccales bacterium]|jgi:prolyl-tRNA synthetase|nr:proline--tRNA ligase [Puniceicoccales bacterium]
MINSKIFAPKFSRFLKFYFSIEISRRSLINTAVSMATSQQASANASKKNAISPARAENFPEWYQQVIKAADLADNSPVRGCMVIRPWGYAIWELVQKRLDAMFKAMGHQNAYFPLFIPLGYFEREARHVEGFAKECAIVTHTRLQPDGKGGLKPAAALEEPLIVRPTSETIIGEMFSKWVHSYRDLPLKINQWANVVRWEMRPRMFLRTTEFLWQEGHTVHAIGEEAQKEALDMLECYRTFAENYMAMPVICGQKSESEKFPGAVSTFTIEAMMQDGKALQAGTSHFLGQNFAKSSGIKFVSESGREEFGWTTSWGVTTRLIGGLIMTHSDDDGLVLPPQLAPLQIVILPIYREDSKAEVLDYCKNLFSELSEIAFGGEKLRVKIDDRDIRGGEKSWEFIKKGVPMRIEIGPRDIQSGTLCVCRRDRSPSEKEFVGRKEFANSIGEVLGAMQSTLFQRAKKYRDENSQRVNSADELFEFFNGCNPGFAYAHLHCDGATEERVKKDFGATIRCLPFEETESGTCIFTGKSSEQRVILARSY